MTFFQKGDPVQPESDQKETESERAWRYDAAGGSMLDSNQQHPAPWHQSQHRMTPVHIHIPPNRLAFGHVKAALNVPRGKMYHFVRFVYLRRKHACVSNNVVLPLSALNSLNQTEITWMLEVEIIGWLTRIAIIFVIN